MRLSMASAIPLNSGSPTFRNRNYEGNPRVVSKKAGDVGFSTLLCTVDSERRREGKECFARGREALSLWRLGMANQSPLAAGAFFSFSPGN